MALTKIKSTGIAANAITEVQLPASVLANLLIAGDNITIEANGRISATAVAASGNFVLSDPAFSLKDPVKNILRLPSSSLAQYEGRLLGITNTDNSTVEGISFNSDGTKMYLMNQSTDKITEWHLSDPWEVANARPTGAEFTLNASVPQDMHFRPDGTKFYIATSASPLGIMEYTLSSAWDLSTASFSNILNTYISPTLLESSPQTLYINPDGDKLFVAGTGSGNATDSVIEYIMDTPWDLSTAVYSGNSFPYLSVGPNETAVNSIFFSDDGTDLYIYGTTLDGLIHRKLSVPWNINTVIPKSELMTLRPGSWLSGIRTVKMFKDGYKLFVVDEDSTDSIVGYTLKRPWGDLGIRSFFVPTAVDTVPRGMRVKPDGTKFYLLGDNENTVDEFEMNVLYDISTSYLTGNTFALPAAIWTHMEFSPDGTKMLVAASATIYNYDLNPAWDITSASLANIFTPAQSASGTNFTVTPDGRKVIIIRNGTGYESEGIYQYTCPAPYDTANNTVEDPQISLIDFEGSITTWRNFHFSEDGSRVYILRTFGANDHTVEECLLTTANVIESMDRNSRKQLYFNTWMGGAAIVGMQVLNGNLYLIDGTADQLIQIQLQ